MKIKLIFSVLSVLCLSFSLLVPGISHAKSSETNTNKTISASSFQKEKQKIIQEEYKIARNAAKLDIVSKNISENSKQAENIYQRYIDKREGIIDKRIEKLNEKYGWKKVPQPQKFSPMTTSGALNIYSTLYVSSYDGTYKMDIHGVWNSYDSHMASEDLLGIDVANSISNIQTYCDTYSVGGIHTGSENNGVHSSGSMVTLNPGTGSTGAVWNIADDYYYTGASYVYGTNNIYATLYFNTSSGNYLVKPSYVHDWATYQWNYNGSLTFSGWRPDNFTIDFKPTLEPHTPWEMAGQIQYTDYATVK